MGYTLAEWGVFVGIITTNIIAIIGAFTALRGMGKRVDAQTKVIEKQVEVVETIEKNTNSTLTTQNAQIANLLSEVKALTAQVAIAEKARAVLAAERKDR